MIKSTERAAKLQMKLKTPTMHRQRKSSLLCKPNQAA